MDYDAFRELWHEALAQAGLVSVPFWPTETVDLRHMDRAYKVYMPMPTGSRPGRSTSRSS